MSAVLQAGWSLMRGWITLNGALAAKVIGVLMLIGALLWWWQWRDANIAAAARAEMRVEAANSALEAARDARRIEKEVRDAPADKIWNCLTGHGPCPGAARLFGPSQGTGP
ncbi:MAG: hypothetical protein MRY63_06335 [Neomegalonema sp.]|nr:hypothetical protein [Neomegalonema sp.]